MTDPGSQKWFYADDGGRQGPVGLDDLRKLVLQGKLKKDDLVWTKGMPEWKLASAVPELFPKATLVPPGSPTPRAPVPPTMPNSSASTSQLPRLTPRPVDPTPPKPIGSLPERPPQSGGPKTLLLSLAGLAILGILVGLIGYPQYRDYNIHSQLGEASVLADGAKTAITEFYRDHDRCPDSNAEADLASPSSISGKYVSEVLVGRAESGACVIRAKFGGPNVSSLLKGQTFGYANPKPGAGNWNCGGSVPRKYWMLACDGTDDSSSAVAAIGYDHAAKTLSTNSISVTQEQARTSASTPTTVTPPEEISGRESASAPLAAPKPSGPVNDSPLPSKSTAPEVTPIAQRPVNESSSVTEHCESDAPQAQAPEEVALLENGNRHLTGRRLRAGAHGEFYIVEAALGYDGQCRPDPYQIYVFYNGKQVGTLARTTMHPRSDGAITDFKQIDAEHLQVRVEHYKPSDPACCASSHEDRVISFSQFVPVQQAAEPARQSQPAPRPSDQSVSKANGLPAAHAATIPTESAQASQRGSTTSSDLPEPQAPITPPVAVDSISFGHSASANGEIRQPDTQFGDKDTIYVSIKANVQSTTAQSLDVVWANSGGAVLHKDRATLSSGPHGLLFNYSDYRGLPIGQYEVGVYVDGKLVSNNAFNIAPSAIERLKNGLEKVGIKVQTH